MDPYDAIRSRRSVYRFKPEKIPDDLLMRILEAGVMALL
ncbi:MAG: hypothetical protein DRN29_10710 [Thermoplasmata archaeon]|nr:MAG: hypothetical protein DRN29_10710 [Thermoplasmata archaeon]